MLQASRFCILQIKCINLLHNEGGDGAVVSDSVQNTLTYISTQVIILNISCLIKDRAFFFLSTLHNKQVFTWEWTVSL
jgi:hypothetical protein